MIPDAKLWSVGDESPDRDLWAQEVSRSTLWAIASIFDLPADRIELFQRWFSGQVGPNAQRRDPGVMEAIAQTLFSFLAAPLPDESSDDGE
jgi:hypothetical protein